jgi:hypothetical protein
VILICPVLAGHEVIREVFETHISNVGHVPQDAAPLPSIHVRMLSSDFGCCPRLRAK